LIDQFVDIPKIALYYWIFGRGCGARPDPELAALDQAARDINAARANSDIEIEVVEEEDDAADPGPTHL
jgi:hypothetical protein